jgi:hypothetical protein
MRSLPLIIAALAACSSSAHEQQPEHPSETRTEPTVAGLRLGHFSNKEHTVGVVIERRENGARMKIDGAPSVLELDANRLHDRTDYSAGANKLRLSIYEDGRTVVYLPEAPNGIDVVRDGDVDPVAGTTIVKEPPVCCHDKPAAATKDQPPEVKLKLGHYVNARRGIGVVIDRTQHAAKVRFDGDKTTVALDPTPGAGGRTDYIKSAGHVVLEAYEDGHMVVFVDDVHDGIAVQRDGDADPL